MLDGRVEVVFACDGNFVKGFAGGWVDGVTGCGSWDDLVVDDVARVGLL